MPFKFNSREKDPRKPQTSAFNLISISYYCLKFYAIWSTNLIFIKYIKDEWSKLGGVSERKKLLVYLLKAQSIQLAAGTILDEAFVPEKQNQNIYIKKKVSKHPSCNQIIRLQLDSGLKSPRHLDGKRAWLIHLERMCQTKKVKCKAICFTHR